MIIIFSGLIGQSGLGGQAFFRSAENRLA